MTMATRNEIQLGGRRIDYRVVDSRTARKLRIRVGLNGVDVIKPLTRKSEDVVTFLDRSAPWLLDQLKRLERLRRVRRHEQQRVGDILFRGEPTPLQIETTRTRARGNAVEFVSGSIVIRCGPARQTPITQSLETWLRKIARAEIAKHLAAVTARLRRQPHRVYIMGQRTKWGNCSAKANLSFNWRLILAPDFVLRYLVTHEAVHLAIPDHSAKFWLTVQSLCRETERAKQWLSANGQRLGIDLEKTVERGRWQATR